MEEETGSTMIKCWQVLRLLKIMLGFGTIFGLVVLFGYKMVEYVGMVTYPEETRYSLNKHRLSYVQKAAFW